MHLLHPRCLLTQSHSNHSKIYSKDESEIQAIKTCFIVREIISVSRSSIQEMAYYKAQANLSNKINKHLNDKLHNHEQSSQALLRRTHQWV